MAEKQLANAAQYIPPTTRQRLEAQKAQLELGLKKINAALDALDSQPNLEAFMEVLRAAGV